MRLRNKKTGEIGYLHSDSDNQVQVARNTGYNYRYYNTLAELVEEWEDVPGPKEYWYINAMGFIFSCNDLSEETIKELKLIGNYFESEEEAKRAVEKLKAWQRLKDLDTEILGWEIRDMPTGGNWQTVNVKLNVRVDVKEPVELLDILFGGEE